MTFNDDDRKAIRRALLTERMRYRVTLTTRHGRKSRGRCGKKLSASLSRAADLALALVDLGDAIPTSSACVEFDDRLLSAMDSRLRGRGSRLAALRDDASKGPRATRMALSATHH